MLKIKPPPRFIPSTLGTIQHFIVKGSCGLWKPIRFLRKEEDLGKH
jgi:hypothetical protein